VSETETISPEQSPRAATAATWALAVHGGAGNLQSDTEHEPGYAESDYLAALERVLQTGLRILAGGGAALDAVETVVRAMEDDERWNAGRGAVLTRAGTAELDASIMDGRSLACGGVATITTVKNPISLARAVMERSPHVLLVGAGAEKFADDVRVERVDASHFVTPRQQRLWQRAQNLGESEHGTVGAVALDLQGNLAASTSTGGTLSKLFGRVGDSPLIGAGTYADNRSCAVSCTGKGEEFIRRGTAHDVAARMRHGGHALEAAASAAVADLRPGDGGLIAVDHLGRVAMPFNTAVMYRGAADSRGRFAVAIR